MNIHALTGTYYTGSADNKPGKNRMLATDSQTPLQICDKAA
jgi:hypothetical protein